jgi:RNA polymerase sigma-70 factor (ECF subfamily)
MTPPEGMPSGLEVLMTTWMASLRRYCLALTGEADAADDVVQETFLEVQRAFRRFEAGGDFGAWLRGIARNVAARRREKYARTRRLTVSLDPRVVSELESLVQAEEMSEAGPVETLRKCLEKLQPDDRELVRARYEADTDVKGLAERAGRTLSWAKTRLMRLRWALAECVRRGMARGEAAP